MGGTRQDIDSDARWTQKPVRSIELTNESFAARPHLWHWLVDVSNSYQPLKCDVTAEHVGADEACRGNRKPNHKYTNPKQRKNSCSSHDLTRKSNGPSPTQSGVERVQLKQQLRDAINRVRVRSAARVHTEHTHLARLFLFVRT